MWVFPANLNGEALLYLYKLLQSNPRGGLCKYSGYSQGNAVGKFIQISECSPEKHHRKAQTHMEGIPQDNLTEKPL